MALTFLKRTPGNPDDIAAATGKAWLGLSAILDGDEVLTAGITPKNPPPGSEWTTLAPTAWNATAGYASVGSLVTNGGALFSSLAAVPAITYTEVARWNDGSRANAQQLDYNNFTTASICARRVPLSGTTLPNQLAFGSDTYRLRYVPGGSATQAAAEVVGQITATFDSASQPYACFQVGTAAAMVAAFGTPAPNSATATSPTRFNGGEWILERQTGGVATGFVDWRATAVAAAGTARYNHTGRHLAVSTSPNAGVFPTNLTGTWRLRQVGGNVNPSPPNAAWASVAAPTAWSASSAYAANALVTSGGNTYRATAAISAPAPTSAGADIALGAGTWADVSVSGSVVYVLRGAGSGRIERFNFDGTSAGAQLNLGQIPQHFSIVVTTAYMLLEFVNSATIRRRFFSTATAGADITLTGGGWGGGISVDGSVIYVANNTTNIVRRLNFDGTSAGADIALGAGDWRGLSVVGNILYVMDATANIVRRFNVDGTANSDPDIALGAGDWDGVSVVGNTLYALDDTANIVKRLNLPAPNAAPADDTTNWEVVNDWSETAAYAQNQVARVGTAYYRAINAIAAPTLPREVDGALTIVNPASGGVMDIRVGTAAQMATAFGNVAITSGGNFELRKIANAPPATDTANWAAVVTSPWNAQRSYLANAIVTNGDPVGYFRANANINVAYNGTTARKYKSQLTDDDRIFSDDEHAATNPVDWRARNATPTPAPPTYTAIINWQATHSNTIDGADYYTQGLGTGQYDGSLFGNYNAFANTLTSPPNGTLTFTLVQGLATGNPNYRLRLVNSNGLPAGKTGVVTGTITIFSNPGSGRFSFRVGTADEMRAAFGVPSDSPGAAFGIENVSGEWVLERENV